MRVLVLGIHWPPETFILRRLIGLTQHGMKVTVVTPDSTKDKEHPAGIELMEMPVWEGPALRRFGFVLKNLCGAAWRDRRAVVTTFQLARKHAASATEFLRRLHQLLPFAGRKADIVHFEWNFTAVHCLPLFELLPSKFIVSCRGSQIQIAPHNHTRQGFLPGLRATFEKAHAIHCVSDKIREEGLQYGLIPAKAHVIRPAVDVNTFRPGNLPPNNATDRLVLVSVGSLTWGKGYEYLLAAMAKLIDRGVDATLHIIGGGGKAEYQRIQFAIHDLGLREKVVLHGTLPPEEVRNILQRADVFVLSSLSEGISNAVLEAMACGVPIVTTDCGGMREAVTDGAEGLVVPVRDPEAMATALLRLALDPERRRAMGRSARTRAESQFSLTEQAEKFAQLYRSVVAA